MGGAGTGVGASLSGQNQLPSWLTGGASTPSGGTTSSTPSATPTTPSEGFKPAGYTEPGQAQQQPPAWNMGLPNSGSPNWNPMSMMMWQLMSGGMQQPSGSGGLYGGFSGGMPDWSKFFGQSGNTGASTSSTATPAAQDLTTQAITPAGYQNSLFDPSVMRPKVQAPAAAAPAAAAPQQPGGNYWDPRYGAEPAISAQDKLKIQGGTLGGYGQPNAAQSNWIRWNLGEQGYKDWQAQNARQQAQNYANASGASNASGYYNTNQGINYAYIDPYGGIR